MSDETDTGSPGKEALIASAEFVKYSTALSTGALVFSVGLLKGEIPLGPSSYWLLVLAWVCLGISIAAGMATYSRIPIQLASKNYDLEDKRFTIPGRIHQITFFLGIICLGAALLTALPTKSQPATPKDKSCTTKNNHDIKNGQKTVITAA